MQKTTLTAQSSIVPNPPAKAGPRDQVSLDVWGFRDTHFQFSTSGAVELSGDRYPLSGNELPALRPWISGILAVPLDAQTFLEPEYPPQIPDPLRSSAFLKAVAAF